MADISKIKLSTGTYDIKDNKARSSITEINNKITPIEKLNKSSKVVFLAKSDQTTFLGDCSLILGEKNILIDIGNETNANTLIQYLTNNKITKLDYIIISHYHDDHVGGSDAEGLLKLITTKSINFSNCNVILPHNKINYAQFKPSGNTIYKNREDVIKAMLTSNNIKYMYATEGQIIKINDNENLSFYNCDQNYYTDYYNYTIDNLGTNTGNTNYNNFSLITIYNCFNHNVIFTGDIETLAESKNYQNIKNCDILKVEHHGLNYNSDNNYLNQLNPKYAVICNSQYHNTPFDYAHATVFTVTSKGAKLFSTRTSNVPIEFIIDYNNIFTNTANISQLNNMQYNLWSGEDIPENADLNNYILPGIYSCRNATIANSLKNSYITISGGAGIGSGFKLIVEATTGTNNFVRQTIISSNNTINTIFYRCSIEGSFANSKWTALYPSNTGSLNAAELEEYWKVDHTSLNNRVAKRNSVVTISLNSTITNQVAAYQVLLAIPKEVIATSSTSYYFLAHNDKGSPLLLYTNMNETNKTLEIKNVDVIPAGTTIKSVISFVEEIY